MELNDLKSVLDARIREMPVTVQKHLEIFKYRILADVIALSMEEEATESNQSITIPKRIEKRIGRFSFTCKICGKNRTSHSPKQAICGFAESPNCTKEKSRRYVKEKYDDEKRKALAATAASLANMPTAQLQ